MIVRGIVIWSALFGSGFACLAATPPTLPCKSPAALVEAVEYALNSQDTNFFFSLCYWDNVPAGEQPINKSIARVHFKHSDDLSKSYSRFQLQPPPADANSPRPKKPRAKQVQRVPNLTVVGMISYRTRGTAQGLTSETIRFSAAGDMEYGRAPDGTYWLTVHIPVDAARPESYQTASVSQSVSDTITAPSSQRVTETSLPVSLDPTITRDPQKTLQAYFAAIAKADRKMASQLTARFAKSDEADLDDNIDTSIHFFATRKFHPEIKESKAIENCAVVVVLDSPTDPDPVYLFKQREIWRVLPGFTRFEIFELADSDLKRFEVLKAWYESRVNKR